MKYVLFACNHNAGRSQMAQAFFERLTPADVRAESAGTMQQMGIDMVERQRKQCDVLAAG